MNAGSAQLESSGSTDEQPGKTELGLTLRRLDVWIDDWRLRMRMMSVCVENCKGKTTGQTLVECHHSIRKIDARGGALVSLIHSNTNNGDPFIRGFTNRLLEDVSILPSSTYHCSLL